MERDSKADPKKRIYPKDLQAWTEERRFVYPGAVILRKKTVKRDLEPSGWVTTIHYEIYTYGPSALMGIRHRFLIESKREEVARWFWADLRDRDERKASRFGSRATVYRRGEPDEAGDSIL
jgi:hypothetical protein